MGNPLQFQVMEEHMRENFNRIRLKCETLLAGRVDELVNSIKGKLFALLHMRT